MSWNGKYITVDSIIEKLFRNAEYRDEFKIDDVIEWVGDCIGLIGCPVILVDKVTDGNDSLNHPDYVDIVDHRGILPTDAYTIVGVRDKTTKTRFRLSQDSFHQAADNNTDSQLSIGRPSYKLQGNFIFTDIKTATLEIAYKALPVSNSGLPLIPDEINYTMAVEWFIREKIDYRLFRRGSLNQNIHQHTDQQRDWYIGKAQTAMLIPSEDEMEVIQSIRLRLRPTINDWEGFFKTTGIVEKRKVSGTSRNYNPGNEVVLGNNGTTYDN